MRERYQKQSRGFTLIEVMVALAVLAIALAAIIQGIGANVSNQAYLRDKTLAHWVAMNRVAELQLSETKPAIGTKSGTMLLADRDWFWTMTVIKFGDSEVLRADIEISAEDGDQPLAKLISYVGLPS